MKKATIKKQPVATKNAPEAVGAYSQAIISGDLIFISGQIGLDPLSGVLQGEAVGEQAEQVMKNIQGVLLAAGTDFENLLKVTIYLVDLADFQKIDTIYSSYLTPPYPARATIGATALPKGAKVEIEAIASVPKKRKN